MKLDRITLYLRILFVLLGTLAAALSLKTYVSDSEFWAITYSAKLGEPGASASVYMKLLFYSLLKPIYLLPLDSVSHVLVARLEFAAIGALTAFIFYRVAKRAFEDEFRALVLTLVLVTCSFFLSQSFRVRSDNLASLIALLGIWILVGWSKRNDASWIARSAALASLNLLLLLSTPKSFYFLVTGAAFMAFLPLGKLDKKQKAAAVTFAYALPPCLIASAFQLTTMIPALRWIERAFEVAFEYYSDSFAGTSGPGTYLTLDDFHHVFILLEQNPLHLVFIAVSLFLWIYEGQWRNREGRGYFALFVAASLLLVLHNQKLPFFIYSLLPLLALGAGFVWRDRFTSMMSHRRSKSVFVLIIGVFVANTARVTLHSTTANSNEAQIEALQPLQKFIKEESITNYYDAIGLFPRLNAIFAFPSPNDRNNSVIMKVVENSKPDLLLYVNREISLEPALGFLLGKSYVDIGEDVWLRAITPKRLASLVKIDRLGSCRMNSRELRDVAKETFGKGVERVHLIELGPSGFIKIEKEDLSILKDERLEWRCEGRILAITRIRPRVLGLKMSLRYGFGFDANY